jgi:hypothetical protein
MLAVKGTYENGHVRLDDPVQMNEPAKVIVTFLDHDPESPSPSKKTQGRFSFEKTRGLLRNLEGSLSDVVVEERRLER